LAKKLDFFLFFFFRFVCYDFVVGRQQTKVELRVDAREQLKLLRGDAGQQRQREQKHCAKATVSDI